MIAGELRRFLRDRSAVRVSRSMRDTAYKVLQVKEKLLAETGREPELETIAGALGIPRQEVGFALEAICDPVSLYDPVFSEAGESVTVMDQIGDTRNTDEHWLEQIALEDALRRLSERERRILALRFYEGRTQTEVAQEVGISQAQVSRLEKNAIRLIKKNMTASIGCRRKHAGTQPQNRRQSQAEDRKHIRSANKAAGIAQRLFFMPAAEK